MSVDTRVQLLIVNHFDELTTNVDIYTEKLLARFDDNDLLADFVNKESKNDDKTEMTEEDNQVNSEKDDACYDPYSEKYSYESCVPFEMPPESTTVKDFLNSCRQKLIDEMKEVKEEIFKSTESEELIVDRERKDDEYIEELKSRIFANRFCFILDIQDINMNRQSLFEFTYSSDCLFELCLIVSDFYMNSQEIYFLMM